MIIAIILDDGGFSRDLSLSPLYNGRILLGCGGEVQMFSSSTLAFLALNEVEMFSSSLLNNFGGSDNFTSIVGVLELINGVNEGSVLH